MKNILPILIGIGIVAFIANRLRNADDSKADETSENINKDNPANKTNHPFNVDWWQPAKSSYSTSQKWGGVSNL